MAVYRGGPPGSAGGYGAHGHGGIPTARWDASQGSGGESSSPGLARSPECSSWTNLWRVSIRRAARCSSRL